MIKRNKLKELDIKGYITFPNITSFTDEISSRHAEFGNVLIKVKRETICKRYNCIKIHYTLNWFKTHPEIYKWVTWETLNERINRIKDKIKEYGHYESETNLNKAFEKMLYYKDYVRENEIIVKSKNSKSIKIYDNEIIKTKRYSNDFLPTW